MCTIVLQNDALWDMGLVRCGICAIGILVNYINSHRALGDTCLTILSPITPIAIVL